MSAALRLLLRAVQQRCTKAVCGSVCGSSQLVLQGLLQVLQDIIMHTSGLAGGTPTELEPALLYHHDRQLTL